MRWPTVVLVGTLWACGPAAAEETAKPKEAPKAKSGETSEETDYRVIPMEGFAAFVKNWDDEERPFHRAHNLYTAMRLAEERMRFTALVRDLDEWNKVFSPAVVIGDDRPTAPSEEFFENEALVVLSVLGPPAEEGEKRLRIARFQKIPPGLETTSLIFLYDVKMDVKIPAESGFLYLVYDIDRTTKTGDQGERAARMKHTLLLAIPKEDAQYPLVAARAGSLSDWGSYLGTGYTF